MAALRPTRSSMFFDALFVGAGRAMILLLPAAVLLAAALRIWDQKPWILVGGLAFQLVSAF